MKKNIILFGAGNNAGEAIKRYGREKIAFLSDNAKEKVGTVIEGYQVISFDEMCRLHSSGHIIVITPDKNAFLIGQLEEAGIFDYLIFKKEDRNLFIEEKIKAEEKYHENNEILMNFIKRVQSLDLIQDISEFRGICSEVLAKNKEGLVLYLSGWENEGAYYGNFKSISDYAGLQEEDALYFPTVSHEDCSPLFSPAFKYRSAVVFSGEYYKRKVQEHRPYIPVFTVGPYISYAKGIYEEKKVAELKRKNGRTLLVFLPHSLESVGRLYDKRQFIDKVLELYHKDFKHIMLCSYWADINDPACQYAQENGMKVVSAGFRFDEDFDRRLRTIIELSDAVVCGDIGTHISYSLSMKKPVGRVEISNNQVLKDEECRSDIERTLEFSGDYEQFTHGFFKYFDEEPRYTQEQLDWMNPVSGFDKIRDREYLRKISRISRDIWKKCRGDLNLYVGGVMATYHEYEKNQEFDLMVMLKDAVGSCLF